MLDINKVYCGNNLELIRKLDNDCVDLTVTSPPYDCYSDDTEVLTKTGWAIMKDVNVGDYIMTLDPETKKIFYQPVLNVFCYPFDGELINFKNQSVDLLVTPNHKMYVEGKDGLGVRERRPFIPKNQLNSSFLKEAADIKISDLVPLNKFTYNSGDNQCCYFNLPQHIDGMGKVRPELKIPINNWLSFFGFWLAEGSVSGSNGGDPRRKRINLKQKLGTNTEKIKAMLDNLPFKFNIYKSKNDILVYEVNDTQLHSYLKQFGNSYTKFIPRDILNLSSQKLKILLDWYLLGDGTKTKIGSPVKGFNCARSFSEQLKEDIMEICIKIGFCARITKQYIVFPNSNHTKIGQHKSKIRYKGDVVCLEVERFNIILVRRNNKPVFCGNSMRKYKGFSWDFENLTKELFRVTKQGGVVVWVVGDATIKGSETGTSFKHALYFKEIGFNLHDTMIYAKSNPPPQNHGRYEQGFEYMFVFSKGKPNTFIPILEPCKMAGKINTGTIRNNGGDKLIKKFGYGKPYKETKSKSNIWFYAVGATQRNQELKHPAIFPEQLAADHIKSWSNEGDLVLDPFAGSGTTLKCAKLLKRNYLGFEISQEYCNMAEEKLT